MVQLYPYSATNLHGVVLNSLSSGTFLPFLVCENRGALQGIFRHKREEIMEAGESCIMRSFIISAFRQMLLGWSKQ
jgi:hypothetical protein